MSVIRQGDVLLVPVPNNLHNRERISSMTPVIAEDDRLIIARGEKSGHNHSFRHNVGATMFRDDGSGGGLFLQIETPAPLEHQEHSPLTVAPGLYQVVMQQEADPSNGIRPNPD